MYVLVITEQLVKTFFLTIILLNLWRVALLSGG